MAFYARRDTKIAKAAPISRLRPFSSSGQVDVTPGAKVTWDTPLGMYASRNRIRRVRVESTNDVLAATVLVQEGQKVKRGEVLAYYSYLFGLGYTEYISPCDGEIIGINAVMGAILVKESPTVLRSNLPGVVARCDDAVGAWVASRGDLVKGAMGAGYGRSGVLEMGAQNPGENVSPSQIGPNCQDKVIVVPFGVTKELLEACLKYRVAGVITGAISEEVFQWYKDTAVSLDWDEFLARYWARDAKKQSDVPPATEIVPALVVTEGFGTQPMDGDAFEILSSHAGEKVFTDGSSGWPQEACVFAPSADVKDLPGATDDKASHSPKEALRKIEPGMKVKILGMSVPVQDGTIVQLGGTVLDDRITVLGVTVKNSKGDTFAVPLDNIQVTD